MKNKQILQILIEEKARSARKNFFHFRQLINPGLKVGWWQVELATKLESFANSLLSGEKPSPLIIQAPPQHGKSLIIIDFIAWLSGLNPDFKTIYTSFSERLGIRANLRLQRIYDSPMFKRVFPQTKINEKNSVSVSGQYLRNREIIEYVNHEGCFRNTTVRGSITGESLDIGVIDDPIKGRADANSKTTRDNVWDWFIDDFFTRFSENAALIAILTRWHVDDPIGRLIEKSGPDKITLLSYPAIAVRDEENRREGEPLFPEHKSLDFLLERKAIMNSSSWESLYQQSPIIQGGEIIKGAWFGRYKILPTIVWSACFGDTAQKKSDSSDYQVAQCWGLGDDGKLYLIDQMRAKFEAYELEWRFPSFWEKQKNRDDIGELRFFGIEDKSSGTELIQKMKNTIVPCIPVKAIPRSVDKLSRVQDVLGYIESGHVMIPEAASWVHDFVNECESFTADDAHDHDDQIDPMCDAISKMLNKIEKRSFFDL